MFFRLKTMTAFICCLCLLGGLFINLNTVSAEPNKKRIAVASFESSYRAERGNRVGTYVADLVVEELFKNKNFEVIERARMEQVLNELGLGLTGVISEESAKQLGRQLGADYLVFGAVTNIQVKRTGVPGLYSRLEVESNVNMRLVDTETGKLVFADSATGDEAVTDIHGITTQSGQLSGQANEAIREAVIKLVDKINLINPQVGEVIEVSGGDVYINLGRDNGVAEGQIYEVYTEGTPLRDSSGKIVMARTQTTGKIKIVRTENQGSVAKIDSGRVAKGSLVRKVLK